MRNREELKRHPMFVTLERIALYMDKYYIDGVIGLLPAVCDVFSALCTVPFVYFTLVVARSVPLTLAVINNTLRDILVGMIPFFVGDVLDFFYRSNSRNLRMIIGFVNGEQRIVRDVNRKAWQSVAVMIILIALIVLMIVLLMKLGTWVVSLF